MGRFSLYFKNVVDPRTGNAKRHDFREMVMIALLSSMCGGRTCVDMADFAANNEAFLRRFMALERGTPSRDTFSRLFRLLDPEPFAAAMAALLELLDIKDAAAADAIHAQRKTAQPVIGKGRHFVLALKPNQGTLHEDAKEWIDDPEAQKEMLSHQHVGGGHGRTGTRTATVSHDIGWLQEKHQWRGLEAGGKIEAVRETKGRATTETRYFIMSRK